MTMWKAVAFALLVACSKEEPKKNAPGVSASSVVDRGLANPQGMAAQGKGALVSQQCGMACGARPGIDSGACTKTCIGSCANEADIAAIDACAARIASQSPELQ